MSRQRYDGPGAKVFTEEEVNRRRAASERDRSLTLATPTLAGAGEDPRRALCSHAELLDALPEADENADDVLDRYGSAVPDSAPRGFPGSADAVNDDDGLGVDEILEQFAGSRDPRPPSPKALWPRGTADLAPSTRQAQDRRRFPRGRVAIPAAIAVLVIAVAMVNALGRHGAQRPGAAGTNPPTTLISASTAGPPVTAAELTAAATAREAHFIATARHAAANAGARSTAARAHRRHTAAAHRRHRERGARSDAAQRAVTAEVPVAHGTIADGQTSSANSANQASSPSSTSSSPTQSKESSGGSAAPPGPIGLGSISGGCNPKC
jgi:hypothetical protein